MELPCSLGRQNKQERYHAHDLKLDSLDVIHAGQDTFPLTRKIRAVSLLRLW